MLQVVQVVLQLLHRPIDRVAVRGIHLRPPRQPGSHDEPGSVKRHMSFQQAYELGALRPGTDQAHLPSEDAQKIRQLVEAREPPEPADFRDGRIARSWCASRWLP